MEGLEVFEQNLVNVDGIEPDRLVRRFTISRPNCSMIGEVWSTDGAKVVLVSNKKPAANQDGLGWPSGERIRRQILDSRLPPGRYALGILGLRTGYDQILNTSTQPLKAKLDLVCWSKAPDHIWNWTDWFPLGWYKLGDELNSEPLMLWGLE
jgi:hypothetical protein